MTVTSDMADKIQNSFSYDALIDELSMFRDNPYIARSRKAIQELLHIHQLDQAEIVRLRRMVELNRKENV